jgi:hypothetical protein
MISLRNVYLKQQLSIKNLRRLSDKPVSSKLDPKVGGLASKLGTTLNPNTSALTNKPKWNDKPPTDRLASDNRNKFSTNTASTPFSRNSSDSSQTSQPSKFNFASRDTANTRNSPESNQPSQPSKFTFPKKDTAQGAGTYFIEFLDVYMYTYI